MAKKSRISADDFDNTEAVIQTSIMLMRKMQKSAKRFTDQFMIDSEKNIKALQKTKVEDLINRDDSAVWDFVTENNPFNAFADEFRRLNTALQTINVYAPSVDEN